MEWMGSMICIRARLGIGVGVWGWGFVYSGEDLLIS